MFVTEERAVCMSRKLRDYISTACGKQVEGLKVGKT